MRQRALQPGLLGLALGMRGALATSSTAARKPMERLGEHPLAGRGWDLYLLAAIALLPVVVPLGPGRIAGVDLLNGAALTVFALVAAASGLTVELPFLLPALLIAGGSFLAAIESGAVPAGLAALVPDLYLYLWFVMLVALLRSREGGGAALQFVWLLAANAVAVSCLAARIMHGSGSPLDLFAAGGPRAAATFAGPDMCADYLVVSVFVALGLEGYVRGRLLVPSLILLILGLFATGSSGAVIALGAGLLAWAAAGGVRRKATRLRLAGGIALALAATLFALRAGAELRPGDRTGPAMEERGTATTEARRGKSRAAGGRDAQRHEKDSSRSGPAKRQPKAPVVTEPRKAKSAAVAAPRDVRPAPGTGPRKAKLAAVAQPLDVRPAPAIELRKTNLAAVAAPREVRPAPVTEPATEPANDFTATASKRRPLSLIGLLIAIAQAFTIVVLSMRRQGGERRARTVSATMRAAMLGGLVATTLHSTMIEKLHFRHDWAFLALVWAASARSLARAPRPMHEMSPGHAGAPRLEGLPLTARSGAVSEAAGAGS